MSGGASRSRRCPCRLPATVSGASVRVRKSTCPASSRSANRMAGSATPAARSRRRIRIPCVSASRRARAGVHRRGRRPVFVDQPLGRRAAKVEVEEERRRRRRPRACASPKSCAGRKSNASPRKRRKRSRYSAPSSQTTKRRRRRPARSQRKRRPHQLDERRRLGAHDQVAAPGAHQIAHDRQTASALARPRSTPASARRGPSRRPAA